MFRHLTRLLQSNGSRQTRLSLTLGTALLMAASSPILVAQGAAPEGEGQPSFGKAFAPATIGPGSVSMLILTIDNTENPEPVGDLAFVDDLPFGMELAAPALVSNTCGGTVTTDDVDDEVELTDGMVGADSTCEVVVNVTATTDCGGLDGSIVECANTTGDLTSDAGNSGTASASLFVDEDSPGFSKSFDLSTVAFGGRSTLTFTIDNTASGSDVVSMSFTDPLPAGMVVAVPANASTDCGDPSYPPTLVATPGTSLISLSSSGFVSFPSLEAGDTCTVEVDVIGSAVGLLGNVTNELMVNLSDPDPVGKAAAVLEVTGFTDPLALDKEFTDDPVAPGGTVTLEFTITNQDRDFPATGLTFEDDLEATLTDLAPNAALPTDPCGAGSSLGFAGGVLTLTGGTLPTEGSCTFSVALGVDAASVAGTYPNTTTAISGTIDGNPETGNTASDLLFVVAFPLLTKEFTDDPVGAGDSVTLEFTITNTEPGSALTDITFLDELTNASDDGGTTTGFLPFPVSVTIPAGDPCGSGSSLTLVTFDEERQRLSLTGGGLAAAGDPGDSCTFSLTIDIPVGFPAGTYTNTTDEISAVLDDLPGPPTVVGPPASDDIVIAGAPRVTKEFVDDPVLPAGGPVTLEFNLTYPEDATGNATAVAFTDDLDALSPGVPGLVATSVDTNTCTGATVDIVTDPTVIDFSDPLMAPGEECTVVLTLTVPPASPIGSFTNTTSDITATVVLAEDGGGIGVTGLPAQDDLLITPLTFSKEFLDAPDGSVIPGDTVTLRFTIVNNGTSSDDDATGILFGDSLSSVLTDLAATGGATVNTCGGTLSGTSSLLYEGGSLTFGSTCTIEVELLVPAAADDGEYLNATSGLSVVIDGNNQAIDPADRRARRQLHLAAADQGVHRRSGPAGHLGDPALHPREPEPQRDRDRHSVQRRSHRRIERPRGRRRSRQHLRRHERLGRPRLLRLLGRQPGSIDNLRHRAPASPFPPGRCRAASSPTRQARFPARSIPRSTFSERRRVMTCSYSW